MTTPTRVKKPAKVQPDHFLSILQKLNKLAKKDINSGVFEPLAIALDAAARSTGPGAKNSVMVNLFFNQEGRGEVGGMISQVPAAPSGKSPKRPWAEGRITTLWRNPKR